MKKSRKITILIMAIGLLVSGITTVDAASNFVNAKKITFDAKKEILSLQVNRASLGFKKTINKKAYKKYRVMKINKITASTVKIDGKKVNTKAITLKANGSKSIFTANLNNLPIDRTKDNNVKIQICGIKVKYLASFKYKGKKKSINKVVGTKKTFGGLKFFPADYNVICNSLTFDENAVVNESKKIVVETEGSEVGFDADCDWETYDNIFNLHFHTDNLTNNANYYKNLKIVASTNKKYTDERIVKLFNQYGGDKFAKVPTIKYSKKVHGSDVDYSIRVNSPFNEGIGVQIYDIDNNCIFNDVLKIEARKMFTNKAVGLVYGGERLQHLLDKAYNECGIVEGDSMCAKFSRLTGYFNQFMLNSNTDCNSLLVVADSAGVPGMFKVCDDCFGDEDATLYLMLTGLRTSTCDFRASFISKRLAQYIDPNCKHTWGSDPCDRTGFHKTCNITFSDGSFASNWSIELGGAGYAPMTSNATKLYNSEVWRNLMREEGFADFFGF